ncbi:putative type II secretion system protein G [Verrucomicrobia bacterium]|nr:putative type II secretion system protein G [Verrucomicrobiota bacterium]
MRVLTYIILLALCAAAWFLLRPVARNRAGQVNDAQAQMAAMNDALAAFYRDTGHYPQGTNGLLELLRQPPDATNWHGPYLQDIPQDPWGNDYLYECPGKLNGNSYDLILAGPPGRGVHPAVTNWALHP